MKENNVNNDKTTGNQALETISTPEGDFLQDFLFRAMEIHHNKLRFLSLFADMQRAFLIDISKKHTFSDNDIEDLESDLNKLQEFITTA